MEAAPSCSAGCGSGAEKDEGPVNCGIELPGFRFHPTDDELVSFYLRKRVLCQHGEKDHALTALQCLIPDLDIYKYDPWDLPRLARLGEGSSGCYFFSPRDRKYRNSTRPNRVTLSGFWKATGTDRPVYSGGSTLECVGLKKSLVFYLGRASKGTKTDWMMHEFRLSSQPECSQKDTCWALCRIFKRKSNSSQCISEMQAFAVEELPCATEGTLNKSEGLDSFGGEDFNEEDSKSETNVCASLTPAYNGPMSASVDIHTPSSYTSQDDLATADCIVISPGSTECIAPSSMKTEPLAECDAPSSMKMEPLTLRINKGSNVWADDLLSFWFSPAITRPLESSRFSGQPCVWGDAISLFTNQSPQESLQVFEPECLGQLSSSPQWNPALPLWDQPAYFQDSNTLS